MKLKIIPEGYHGLAYILFVDLKKGGYPVPEYMCSNRILREGIITDDYNKTVCFTGMSVHCIIRNTVKPVNGRGGAHPAPLP